MSFGGLVSARCCAGLASISPSDIYFLTLILFRFALQNFDFFSLLLFPAELESYSSVMSTFRAQGGLCKEKARILEDLRKLLHISQDRHKAEARRVANDERLTTVAEM